MGEGRTCRGKYASGSESTIMKWPEYKLSKIVAQFISGGTPSTKVPEYWGGKIPWITGADINNGEVCLGRRYISEDALKNSATSIVPKGSILMVTRTGVGKIAIAPVDIAISQDFTGIVLKEGISPKFALAAINSRMGFLMALQRGATIKGVIRADVKNLSIPIPPPSEQDRIVDIISRAEGIVRLRREAQKKAGELIPALFLEMFGDPATNPKGWPMVRLGDLAEKMSDGPFGSNLKTCHYTEKGVRVIRLQNIGIGFLNDEDKAFISNEHFASLPRNQCLPGDVIIGTLGDPNLRAMVLPLSIPEALNKADCVQFRCRPEVVDPEYICWLMNMPTTLVMAASLVQGITRTRISMGRLREMFIPVPAIRIQGIFAEHVGQVRSLKFQQANAAKQAEATFEALVSRVFES